MRSRFVLSLACLTGAVLALVAGAPSALATVPSAPASWTPAVTTTVSGSFAYVRQLVACGNTMYAVGTFNTVSQGGKMYTRNNAFSFSATTGAVTTWNPNPNGEVNSIALSPNCSTAYLGGKFTAVGAVKVSNLAAVRVSTGAVLTTFGHTSNGMVNTLTFVNNGSVLLAGGGFTAVNGTARGYYASLSPSTGKVTNYLSLAVAGQLPGNSGGTMVYNQQVSASGSRLLFEGDFTTIAGKPRLQLAEVDLGATSATLDPWYDTTINSTDCATSEEFYARDAAFSPDGQTIYIATTGYKGSSPYCDSLVAFTNTAPASVKWINKTGGDSLYAVAATAHDVYIGGHERWADNPEGSDSCGPGCVSRPGIGDLSAASGQATTWNPTRSRGRGVDDLLITTAGLWVASDTADGADRCAGAYHPGICFFPGTA